MNAPSTGAHSIGFIAAVAELYPLVHSALDLETVAGHSLLYRWAGASAEKPTVLMAHYDVVAATDERWEYPPFGAELVGEGDHQAVWARGTLDDKGTLASILEAVEASPRPGFHARSTTSISPSPTTRRPWETGRESIVALLEARGVRPDARTR
ncbi:MAG: M20/M25/M40 family metallo-hydrolase [Galbitalea sp.]